MKGPSWLVIVSTFLLEIIAFGLAIGAMTRRSKVCTLLLWWLCFLPWLSVAPSAAAVASKAGAIVLLFFGQAVIMGVTGCFCCGSGSYKGKARAFAILAFLLAWFCFVVAELCLVVGAALNKVHTTTHLILVDESSLSCKEVRKSVFAAGAAFTFLTLLFGEIYYLSLVKASDGSWEQSYKTGAPTISMTSYP